MNAALLMGRRDQQASCSITQHGALMHVSYIMRVHALVRLEDNRVLTAKAPTLLSGVSLSSVLTYMRGAVSIQIYSI